MPAALRMVGVTGFEPATSWSQTKRSTKLSYTPELRLMLITARPLAHAENYERVALWKQQLAQTAVWRDGPALGFVAARLAAAPFSSAACLNTKNFT
jgi:hypothetical protein